MNVRARFWAKVAVKGPHECWEWRGARGGKQGQHAVFAGPDTRSAYRQLYLWTYGPLERHQDVRHTCDNGLCCNPRHLVPGTRAENMQDASLRGRIASKANGKWKDWRRGGRD